MDNLVTRDAILEHDLNGVMGISLMTVVRICVRACHDDSPMIRLIGGADSCDDSSGGERFH